MTTPFTNGNYEVNLIYERGCQSQLENIRSFLLLQNYEFMLISTPLFLRVVFIVILV